MNANELADDMENSRFNDINYNKKKAADFVRQQQEKLTKYELRHVAQRDRIAILEMQHKQQQAEIEAFKKEAALQRLSDFTQEADNEPVAWMLLGLEDRKPKLINLQVIEHLEGTWIPLYTHLAKTLTDDAIRYRWLRKEFGAGRETYIGESMPSGEMLDEYIDKQLRKAQE